MKRDIATILLAAVGAYAFAWAVKNHVVVSNGTIQIKKVAMGVRG